MSRNIPLNCFNRRSFVSSMIAGSVGILSGCGWDGHFTLLGYSTRPNYDLGIKTVYVPIFQNKVFQTTPHRELEMELNRAIIREIESKTPYKVTDDPDRADTELLGTVVTFSKNALNRTQQNDVREVEYTLAVELVWRDLRDGRILTNPRRAQGEINAIELPAFDPNNPPIAPGPEAPIPVRVSTTGRGIPELGESSATGQSMAINRMAVQIVSMMENPWMLNCDK
jgi:hypothetical protein